MLLDQAAAGQHTFDALFLTGHSPVTTYDYLYHVHIPQQLQAQLQLADVAPWQQAEKRLEALVRQVCHALPCSLCALPISIHVNSHRAFPISRWSRHRTLLCHCSVAKSLS